MYERNLIYGFGYINMYTKSWNMKTFGVLALVFIQICSPNRENVVAALLNCPKVCPCVCPSDNPHLSSGKQFRIFKSHPKNNDRDRYKLMRKTSMHKNHKYVLSCIFRVKTLFFYTFWTFTLKLKSIKKLRG